MEDFKYKSVLLVDDSYVDNLISRKILQTHAFAQNIVIIDFPKKAINYLQQCVQNGCTPDIIFLDIRMPEMDGFQFLRSLNEIEGIERTNLKIYILSSSLDPDDLKQIAENDRVSRFISKPLTERILNEIG